MIQESCSQSEVTISEWVGALVSIGLKDLLMTISLDYISSGGDRIPDELFQILKDDASESAALNMPANLENSVATGLEKINFHFNPKESQ